MMNIFEKATKNKIRFNYRGQLSVEDLWDLDVIELDNIFKQLNSSKRQLSEDSLLETKTAEDTLVNTQIKIIKHIVETKLEEKQARLEASDRRDKKQKIMQILANKQDSALVEKTEEELTAMLNEL